MSNPSCRLMEVVDGCGEKTPNQPPVDQPSESTTTNQRPRINDHIMRISDQVFRINDQIWESTTMDQRPRINDYMLGLSSRNLVETNYLKTYKSTLDPRKTYAAKIMLDPD